MITIAALAQQLRPLPADLFQPATYSEFRAHFDCEAGERPVHVYALPGAVLVTDAGHHVLGKILAPSVDAWGLAENTRYFLPGYRVKLSWLHRFSLSAAMLASRSVSACAAAVGRQSGNAHRKMDRKRQGTRLCASRIASNTPKWKTVRLAG